MSDRRELCVLGMNWLNYHHLFYFHRVARTGSVTAAARELRVRQPTISAQLKLLEESLGVALFERRGRRLELTDEGDTALAFADEIFRLGRDLRRALETQAAGPVRRAVVGVSDTVPKFVVRALLAPLMSADERTRLIIREGPELHLFAGLEQSELDLVLTDHRPPSGPSFDEQVVLESELALYAASPRHEQLSGGGSGRPLPILLPGERSPTRRNLENWFFERDLELNVVAEVDDSALAKILAADGRAALAAPTVVGPSVQQQFGLRPVMALTGLAERYLAYTPTRRRGHPATVLLLESLDDAARSMAQGQSGGR